MWNISEDFETNKARFLELDQIPHTNATREESNQLVNWFRAQRENPEVQTKEGKIQELIQVQREEWDAKQKEHAQWHVTKKQELMPADFFMYQCECGFKTHQPRAIVYHPCPKGAQS
jgi:hypothetical protein